VHLLKSTSMGLRSMIMDRLTLLTVHYFLSIYTLTDWKEKHIMIHRYAQKEWRIDIGTFVSREVVGVCSPVEGTLD